MGYKKNLSLFLFSYYVLFLPSFDLPLKSTLSFAFFSSMFPYKLLLFSHLTPYLQQPAAFFYSPFSKMFSFVFPHCFPNLSFLFSAWMFVSSSSVSATSLGQQEPEHPQRPLSHAKSCT